jgi:hypothetical protein
MTRSHRCWHFWLWLVLAGLLGLGLFLALSQPTFSEDHQQSDGSGQAALPEREVER